jgi:serine/threonine protein kinase
VADFGLSAKYESENFQKLEGQIGTLIYMAPELIRVASQYSRGVDIFATGVIMYMLLTGGEHPFYRSSTFNTQQYREKLLQMDEFKYPSHFSELARNMFLRLTKF